ncbi:MAG: redoxin family protein [Candidatus Paceibacterota bacterium]
MPLLGRDNLVGVRAPEFKDGMVWLNSKPLKLEELLKEGKVVMIDFWTYSCINCIRTLPHVVGWAKKYRDKGLVIVGVHTPEFDFEKEKSNVEKAIADFSIEYPVVLDNDYVVWNSYANRYWPRKLIIGKDGSIVYDHAGEGNYGETEKKIRELLSLADDNSIASEEGTGGICYPTTPEIYLGHERGTLGNEEGFKKDQAFKYEISDDNDRDKFYLRGDWIAGSQFIEHAGKEGNLDDFVQLNFSALSVNVVLGSKDGEVYEVLVSLDGQPLSKEIAGEDVKIKDGKSILEFKADRMYNLIDSKEYLDNRKLKLSVKSDQFRAFAFTFGACAH